MKKLNAVIYGRVSTTPQDNESQIKELKEYAEYKRYNVLRVFEEKTTGMSKAAGRPEFSRLISLVEKEQVDVLLIWEFSRLGRSISDVLLTIEDFNKRKINVFAKKESISTFDDDGNLSIYNSIIISLLAGFAALERQTFKERSISGIRHNVSKGGSGTGVIKAFGYEKIEKMLYVNAEEAKVVRLIFTKYLSGLGCGQIAQYLNNENIPTKYATVFGDKEITNKVGFAKAGNQYKWVDGTVYSILKNSIYKGDRKHKGEIFKIEPIVDSQTFDRVQVRLQRKCNKNSSKSKYFNPLKDIIKCGNPNCEERNYGYYMHKRADNKDNAYKCITKRYATNSAESKSCGNPSINIDKLLHALFIACQSLFVSDSVEKKSSRKDALEENIETKLIEINHTQKSILELDSKMDSLIKMNISEQITAKKFTEYNTALLTKMGNLNDRLRQLAEEKEKLENLKNTQLPSGGYSVEVFNQYIKDAVEYIKVYPAVNEKVFKGESTFRNDTWVIVEVKSLLALSNQTPANSYFGLSRYSSKVVGLELNSMKKDAASQIRAGKYSNVMSYQLEKEDLKNPVQMKHPYLNVRLKQRSS